MAWAGHSRAHLRHLSQKILEPEIDRLVGNQRQVGGHDGGLVTRPDEGVEDELADPAHLAQPGKQHQRNLHHVAVGVGVRLGRVAQAADVIGDDGGGGGAVEIGAIALRAGHPIVAGRGFERVPALVDHDHDGIFVPGLDRRAIALVREPGIFGHLADADHVRIEEITERLDVFRQLFRVVGERRLFVRRIALVGRARASSAGARSPR